MIRTEFDVRDWRRGLVDRLGRAQVADPRREVGLILREECGTALPARVTEEQRGAVEAVAARRAGGMPLAYALGSAGFRYLDLLVNQHVLIPRPETEGLVQLVLDWGEARGELRGVEIGVGSGAVTLSLVREGRFAWLVGSDVSTRALEVARMNGRRLGAPGVRWVAGSLFAPFSVATRFEVIVANPPYLTETEFAETDPAVREYEPREALVSPPDGLSHLAAICRGAGRHLAAGGLLAVEIDSRRGAESAAIAAGAGLDEVRIHRDLFGRDRYLTARGAAR